MEDKVDPELVPMKIADLHKQAMNRNYLEHLKTADVFDWESTKINYFAKQIVKEGGEELWTLKAIKYSLSAGLFETYLVDIWQNNLADPQLVLKDNGTVEIGDAIKSTMLAATVNSVWYILQSIDDKFKNLRPVHVSRAVLGPYENQYMTSSSALAHLLIMPELLNKDPDINIMHFSRQYSYAPNTNPKRKNKQLIYRDNWSDEILIVPSKVAERVSDSVLGSNVRIFDS